MSNQTEVPARQQIGNYRLLRLLGRGAFAEVYLGEHIYLKRRAALKLLRTSLEEEDIEQFLLEAQVLARLNHPNIVRVLEFFVERGTPVLVMDLASRGTLRQYHPSGSCLSLETTVSYVRQIASALQYAHNHQIVHRDVKPENMLHGAHGEVLLSDFGISMLSPSPEQLSTQEMAGTIPYMAPEQIRGRPTFASDQYALGIVVYEWLCGSRPFKGAQWQIIQQQVFADPPRLREKDPSLPQAVEDVVLRALAKEPQQRYASVQLFAQALERASHSSRLAIWQADEEITAPLDPLLPQVQAVPKARRIFISASQADQNFVAHLRADLHRRGIAVWNEPQSDLTDREDAIRQAIRAVDILLLVVSPHTQDSESVLEHLRIASMYQRRLVFVWAAGEDISAALPREWGKTVQVDLIDARQRRYEEVLDEMVACLVEEPGVSPQEESTEEPNFEPRNPYKGLRAFTSADADDFFGRDMLIDELVNKLKERDTRLLSVIGASGSGKSSVVMAGLLPRLHKGALPHSDEWVYLQPMVPGAQPVEALALALAPNFPKRSLKTLREDLDDESARGLHRLGTQLVNNSAQKVVLFVDQFEELFTLTISEQERQHFINLLLTALSEPQGPVIVILTLRADFYDRPMAYPELGRLLLKQQVAALQMDVHDLRAAIKRPAELPDVQLTFEGNLIGDLLFELQGQSGALPLLQFTLDQLFERRSGHRLTLQAYREIGGVKGALAKQAEAAYASLPSDEHRRLARALFLRLIDPGMTEQDTTRRRAAISELALPTPEETELQQQVTAYFLAARLLTSGENAGIATIEVSHEALIRAWGRLAEWLREARDDIRLQQTLSEDVAEWQQRGKPRDRLYRGSQLKDAQNWASRNISSRDEDAFLHASVAQRTITRLAQLALALLLVAVTATGIWQLLSVPNPTLVTSLDDSGPGSLRQVLGTASRGSIIKFAPNLKGAIRLKSKLDIGTSLTIQGPGERVLAISGSNTPKSNITVLKGVTLTVSGLTITAFTSSAFQNNGALMLIDSNVSGNTAQSNGGGIESYNRLTLINSIISNNMVASEGTEFDKQSAYGNGGGIYNHGMLMLINSTIAGNVTSRFGGGLFNGEPKLKSAQMATMTVINSTVSGNTACRGGGGIYFGFTHVALRLSGLTVSGNTVGRCVPKAQPVALNGAPGGGIYNTATLSLMNSTISGNVALNGPGGGIYSHGTFALSNSTITGNTSSFVGGGIAISNGHAFLTFCTIYGNTAAVDGGGIAIGIMGDTGPSRLQMSNSVVTGNHAPSGPDIAGTVITNNDKKSLSSHPGDDIYL